jgi:hypothetical protein
MPLAFGSEAFFRSRSQGGLVLLGFNEEIVMSIQDHQNRLQAFISEAKLNDWGIRYYGVIYSILDFEVASSAEDEFNAYNVLVKRTHSYPYNMQQLSLVSHKVLSDCNSIGRTVKTATSSAKRKCINKATQTLRWGMYSARFHNRNFIDYTKDIEPYRIGDIPDVNKLDEQPQQELSYAIPAYSGKTIYLSGLFCSYRKKLNWDKKEVHDAEVFVASSTKSLEAAIAGREQQQAEYVAQILTAA